MLKKIKRYIFKNLSFENYLRLHQRGFLMMYNMRLLKLSNSYNYHYYIKKLLKEGDIVIDIGANLGYYAFQFAKCVGKTGKVYAVEPIQIYNKIFNEIAERYENITLYPFALGVEEKSIKMVSSLNNGYFRTGLPHVYDARRDGEMTDRLYSFEAEMKTPSKLFDSLKRIDYIKCDIEGFEYTVLSDMKEIINRNKPKVQVEVWGENEDKMMEMFRKMGYIPYKLKKNKLVCIENEASKIEGDYIFIHNDQI